MTPEDVLSTLPIWRGKPILVPVEEGRTNRNFIIHGGDHRYFGRVGVDLPHHGISRENERLCAQLAADTGIAPEVCYAADGVLVTRFVEGETLRAGAMHDAELLSDVASLLRRLHNLPVRTSDLAPRCGVAMSLAYLEALPDDALPVARATLVERLGSSMLGGQSLVHCDIIPENLIRSASGLMLIDWEYAGVGIPEIDLASIVVNADLDDLGAERLLAAYGSCDLARLEQQRFALVIREALWCLVQMQHSGPTGDLVSYTRTCIERMSKELA